MLTGVAHIGFTVRDISGAAAFYEALFGYPPEIRGVYDAPYTAAQVGYPGTRLDIAIFKIAGSGVRLELIEYLTPQGAAVDTETKNPGTAHLCLLTDDIDADFNRLVELGARPRSREPVRVESGPNEGRHVCYLRDPEGFTIELFEVDPAAVGPQDSAR